MPRSLANSAYIYTHTYIIIFLYIPPSVGEADAVPHTSFDMSRVYILFFFFQLPNEYMTNFHEMNSKLPFPHRILAQE